MTTSLLSEPTPPIRVVQPTPLLHQVPQAARQGAASEPTIAQLVSSVQAYILWHGKRHPREPGLPAMRWFLQHLVRTEKQPLPALEFAPSALELLDDGVLGIDLDKRPRSSNRIQNTRLGWESSIIYGYCCVGAQTEVGMGQQTSCGVGELDLSEMVRQGHRRIIDKQG